MINIDSYDEENIFSKILKKQIPSEKIFEGETVYAFKDINPQAPTHILVIPKGKYCSLEDFLESADDGEILELIKSIKIIVKNLNIKNGYRLITNVGVNGGQEVPHLHFHILAGKKIGRLTSP